MQSLFNNPHPPLLFTSGDQDKILPATLNYDNYKKYRNGNSTTYYTEFNNRNHLVFGQPGWKEDAEYIFTGWRA